MKLAASIAIALATFAPAAASAQTDPKFTFGDAKEVEAISDVDWTATAEAGAVLTTGNARTTTATASAKAARIDPDNKLAIELGLAYVRSSIFVASDANMNGTIGPGEIDEQRITTANSWLVKARYDRFLTAFDSLYAAASASADRPAGKELVGGVQVGYSRRLVKTAHHELVGEAGYDFTYEDLVVGDGTPIHSARVFTGYTGTVNDKTGITGSVEVLANINTLEIVPEEAGPLEDTRVNLGAALTTKLTSAISFSVSFGAKLDNRPAPRPPLGIPYDAGFVPVAEKLDTITKAALIVSLF